MASIHWESELMRNQKHAQVLSPESSFSVIQTPTGAVYFSIGTDHNFYVTREVQASAAGWDKIDQSSSLSQNHGGARVVAKCFAVSQNPETLAFDIALVVTVAGADALYLSMGNSAASVGVDPWKGIQWCSVPFDAAGAQPPAGGLKIADVFLMLIPAEVASVEACFVDIEREPNNALRPLDRYYIDMTSAPYWTRHKLAIDLKAGSITSCIGRRSHDRVAGIYTFGMIANIQELIFTPRCNVYKPDVAPNPARLFLPAGPTSIASCLDADGSTNLFVAAREGIYIFTPDKQGDKATPSLIIENDPGTEMLSGVRRLSANSMGGRTTLCALNAEGDLVVASCDAGSEAIPSSWTPPMPILAGADDLSFFVDAIKGNTVLFAEVSGQDIIQLTEDPVTTSWVERRVALPPTNYDDVVEYDSFTTQIRVTDENGVATPNTAIHITAVTPTSVYINDEYHALTPETPLLVASDATGSVTIIQETQNLEAVAFRVGIPGNPSTETTIRPMANVLLKLGAIKTGDDLAKIQIPTGNGSELKPLLPSDFPPECREEVAKTMTKLLEVSQSLPDDGSVQPRQLRSKRLQATPFTVPMESEDDTWGVSFQNGAVSYHEGEHAMQFLAHTDPHHVYGGTRGSVTLDDVGSLNNVRAGSFWRWIKRIWNSIKEAAFRKLDGVWHFICAIAKKTYAVALDCYNAVAGAFEFVFNQIKVFFRDVVAWLGFVFNWDDILRTHTVLKNVFVQFGRNMVSQFDKFEGTVDNAFARIESKLNAWAAISDAEGGGDVISTHQKAAANAPGKELPQVHWGVYHTKNGIRSAETGYNPDEHGLGDELEGVFQDLIKLVRNEEQCIRDAAQQLRDEVADNMGKLTPLQALKKIVAISSILVTKTARNVLVTLIDLLKLVVKGFLDLLSAPLKIPVFSLLYHQITRGSELSVLDLFCLITAIPATILHKLACHGRAPFPPNAQTQALIDAASWSDLQVAAVTTTTKSSSSSRALTNHVGVGEYISDSVLSTIQATTNMIAPIGIAVALLLDTDAAKTANIGTLTPFVTVAQLVALSPNIAAGLRPPDKGDWMTPLNDALTVLAVAKVAFDNSACRWALSGQYAGYASPVLEGVLNVVWFVPSGGWIDDAIHVTEEERRLGETGAKPSDWVSLVGAILGVVQGAAMVFTVESLPPPVRAVAEVAAKTAMLGYAGMSFLNGVLVLKGT